MSYEVEDYYEVYDVTIRRARKDHACDACDATIRRGDLYAHVGMVFSGRGESLKRCARCELLHRHLRDVLPSGMWPAERLDCGISWEEEHDGPQPAEFAFMSTEEAQAKLIQKGTEA